MTTLQLLEVPRTSKTSTRTDNAQTVFHSNLTLRQIDQHLSVSSPECFKANTSKRLTSTRNRRRESRYQSFVCCKIDISENGVFVSSLWNSFVNKTSSGVTNASFNGIATPPNTEKSIPLDYLTQKLEVCPDFMPNFRPETPWLCSTGNALRKKWTLSESTKGDGPNWAVSSTGERFP